jgi:hypothetical protein
MATVTPPSRDNLDDIDDVGSQAAHVLTPTPLPLLPLLSSPTHRLTSRLQQAATKDQGGLRFRFATTTTAEVKDGHNAVMEQRVRGHDRDTSSDVEAHTTQHPLLIAIVSIHVPLEHHLVVDL